jgi:two-component system chemotaxis response regulator CheY
MLEALGHEVVGIAVDGKDAIDRYDRLHPELVFMDVRMPNINGLSSLQKIIEQFPDASVIVYTGGEPCKKEAFAAGAQGYLEKPFSLDALAMEIGKVIVRRNGKMHPEKNDVGSQ